MLFRFTPIQHAFHPPPQDISTAATQRFPPPAIHQVRRILAWGQVHCPEIGMFVDTMDMISGLVTWHLSPLHLTSDGLLEVGFAFATAANLIVACPGC